MDEYIINQIVQSYTNYEELNVWASLNQLQDHPEVTERQFTLFQQTIDNLEKTNTEDNEIAQTVKAFKDTGDLCTWSREKNLTEHPAVLERHIDLLFENASYLKPGFKRKNVYSEELPSTSQDTRGTHKEVMI